MVVDKAGDAASPNPAIILVFSGKRKSGKDYVTDKLKELLGDKVCEIMKLSAPLKKQYAVEHDLDFEKLLDASDYKEKVRVEMIAWGEARRNADPGYFCRLSTLHSPGVHKPVWIISDARRKTDFAYFKQTYPEATVTVRVVASMDTRVKRGFIFTEKVDDAPSECDLDDVTHDMLISNNGSEANHDGEQAEAGSTTISDLVEFVKSKVKTD